MTGAFSPLDADLLWIAGWAIKLVFCIGLVMVLALEVVDGQILP